MPRRCALNVRRVARTCAFRRSRARGALAAITSLVVFTGFASVAAQASVAAAPAGRARPASGASMPPALASDVAQRLPADAQRLLAAARMWSTKHRDDLASQSIDKALLIAPDAPDLLAEQARIQLRIGRTREAQDALARLRRQSPGSAQTEALADELRVATSGREEFATIRLLARSGQSAEAARRLVALFPHGASPGPLGVEYYQILSGTKEGRVLAVDGLRQRIAANPDDVDAMLVLAGLLNGSSDTRAEANRLAWRLALRPDADHAAAMNVWRHVLQSAGADPAYRDALRAWLALVPDDAEFQDRVAAIDARLDAQRRLERDPDYIAQQRGLKALARGDLASAEPLLAQAAHARADDANAVGGLGLARMREGRRDEARVLFLRAAALDADDRGKWEGLARTAAFWGTLADGRAAAAAGRAQDAANAARAALAMQPDSPDAKLLLADALLAQHDWQGAEPLLRSLLSARAPGLGAVRSMQTLLDQTGRGEQFGPLIEALRSRFSDPADRRSLDAMRGGVLADEASREAAQGKLGPAAQRYEASLRLSPDAPWTRFALARLYRDIGLPQLGRDVMNDGMKQSASPEMFYASALYLNSIDDVAGAKQALARVDDAGRSESMRALARTLDAQLTLTGARAAFASGDRAGATRMLEHAETLSADDPDMLAGVGTMLIDAGDADRGLALLRDWIRANPARADAGVRLRYGDLLGHARRDAELDSWLAQIRAIDGLDESERSRLEDQALRLALREIDDALDSDDYARAQRLLARVSAAGQRDPRYALEVADVQRAQGHYDAARAALAPLLAATPNNADAQLALARIEAEDGERRAALAVVRRVVDAAPEDDVDTRISAARRLSVLGQYTEAGQITDALRVAYPGRADVTVQAGRIAQDLGHYQEAESLYRMSAREEKLAGVTSDAADGTPAQAALAGLQQRRDPMIEAGVLPAYKSGDAGISEFHAWQAPVYVQIPYRYDGHFFAHIDTVTLDAGKLSLGDWPNDIGGPNTFTRDTFGTFARVDNADLAQLAQWRANNPALADAVNANVQRYASQRATGVALGTGYVSDAWRVDIGTTPLGFPVHYLVGGIRYRFDAGPASFSASVSRRPQTGSVLAYAGMHDPVTGAVWGGVRRDGIDLHSAVDVGRVSVFADLGVAELTGRNVASNQEVTLRTGFITPVWQRATMRVNTGLIGNAWHYTDNLRFYSYGQGGYYSPQRYLSLGVPLEWEGRHDALTWDITATVGLSNAYEKDSPYYPNGLPSFYGPGFPPLASGSNLVYGGSSTQGVSFSYGISAIAQYRVNAHLVAGVRVEIDHAHDYAPSAGMVYVRYSFDARKKDRSLSPTPVRLYSSF
ncbi:cellulose synthase subunit BcsC-related outer membrane protein [Paraburkholderia diazotrophica]|uniref:Tetratricopeptide repeat-containing protein n=1 Tax=Paraburkholderia diazotrophica TaxID=667676 RepID=A0A1H6T490_9BURK|nr:cellulose synthase subunit BcsC-related outer membrane protein [Paraburkholderia diazotrophica]SEI71075.1 Tetratricopeptide repeat-containing protein [Paraburkholderia diazotrophica]